MFRLQDTLGVQAQRTRLEAGGVVASITPDAPLRCTDPSYGIGPRGSLCVVPK
jgi:hypothetical protein